MGQIITVTKSTFLAKVCTTRRLVAAGSALNCKGSSQRCTRPHSWIMGKEEREKRKQRDWVWRIGRGEWKNEKGKWWRKMIEERQVKARIGWEGKVKRERVGRERGWIVQFSNFLQKPYSCILANFNTERHPWEREKTLTTATKTTNSSAAHPSQAQNSTADSFQL